MTMRQFLDAILAFIGSESLTDEEYASTASLGLTQEYNLKCYNALKAILLAREEVSAQLVKLKAFFQAKGLEVDAPAKPAQSNIFIGGGLDDPGLPVVGSTGGPSNADLKLEIDALSDEVNELSEEVDELAAEVAQIDPSQIAAVIAQVEELSGEVDGLSTDVLAVQGSVTQLESDVDSVQGEVDTLSTTVGGLSSTVGTISGTVDSLSTTVTGLSADLSALSGTVGGLSSDLTGLEGDVSDLETSVTDILSKLTKGKWKGQTISTALGLSAGAFTSWTNTYVEFTAPASGDYTIEGLVPTSGDTANVNTSWRIASVTGSGLTVATAVEAPELPWRTIGNNFLDWKFIKAQFTCVAGNKYRFYLQAICASGTLYIRGDINPFNLWAYQQ